MTRPKRHVPILAALTATVFALPFSIHAQPTTTEVVEQVRSWRVEHEREILTELFELIELPNVAADLADVRRNAEHLVTLLEARGVEARWLEVEGAPPVVFGERRAPGAERTVVFYAHYDGQPVEAARWSSPPWTPVVRNGALEAGGEVVPAAALDGPWDGEWRIYGRSASDDKGPIVALMAALDALDAHDVEPSVNLKFFFEGEEEAGSPHLAEILRRHRALLGADLWIFCDGPMHPSRRMQVVYGVRGIVGLDVTVYGPVRSLHSGHYGNWAPNPISLLADLLSSLRDADGRISIEGFHDDVREPTAAEVAAVAGLPAVGDSLRRELGLARTEGDGAPVAARILLPAVNFRGLRSGAVGAEAKNAIPTEASASIDFRLVPHQTPDGVRSRVEAHLRGLGYHLVAGEPDLDTRRAHPRIARLRWEGGYPPARTDLELPAARAVVEILGEARGREVLRVPTLGGSLPLYLFEEILATPFLVVPVANHDNNQHAPDENLRLQNLRDAVEVYAALVAGLGRRW